MGPEHHSVLSITVVGALDEIDRTEVRIGDSRAADDALINGFRACAKQGSELAISGNAEFMHIPHTASAPYFKDSSRVGSSPDLTIGARTHFPTNPGRAITESVSVARATVAKVRDGRAWTRCFRGAKRIEFE